MSAEAGHGTRDVEMYRFGFALFLLAEGMLFLTLFSTRFLLAGIERPSELNQILAAAVTGLMLLSVFPALDARRAAELGEAAKLRDNLLLTLGLGALLLPAVAWEWASLTLSPASRFGSVFFTALGIHAVHVVAGVVVLAGLAVSTDLGRFAEGNHFAVEAGILFWLFVVGVWVALYAVFYLL